MSKVTTYARWESMDDFAAGKSPDVEVSYEYEGPIAKLDRWAQNAAKTNAATAGTMASTLGGEAQGEHASLDPFFNQEMRAEHGYDPNQINEMLTSAEAGAGGAAGDAAAKTNDLAARTRNASGFTKSLQEQARDRMKTAAGASEGIAAADVGKAKELNQQGAAGLSGLYGTDIHGQLDAMGQQAKDEQDEVQAGQSGWLQNAMNVAKTVSGFTMPKLGH